MICVMVWARKRLGALFGIQSRYLKFFHDGGVSVAVGPNIDPLTQGIQKWHDPTSFRMAEYS